jgi:hypothetical protein
MRTHQLEERLCSPSSVPVTVGATYKSQEEVSLRDQGQVPLLWTEQICQSQKQSDTEGSASLQVSKQGPPGLGGMAFWTTLEGRQIRS